MGGPISTDQSLGDTTPDQPREPSSPVATAPLADIAVAPRSVADILAAARLPEKRAHICTRADLQARYDELLRDLAGLVNERGELVDDAEASLGEATATAQAQAKLDELEQVRAEMADSMWDPLFRGISSDDLAVFNKEHYPTEKGADLTEYNNLLIARTMVEPTITVDEVKQLRGVLHFKSIMDLVKTANAVVVGTFDAPKSLTFSVTSQGS